jgi:NitT/TauT family transport system substrate-binding protein
MGRARLRATGLWIVCLMLLAMMLASCGGDEAASTTTVAGSTTTVAGSTSTTAGTTTTAAPVELTKVTFAVTNPRAIQYYPFYVAKYLGYYAAEGLDVEIVIVNGTGAAVQQVVAGNVDIANPAAPGTAQGVAAGNCLKIFYEYHYENVFGLATPESGPIQTIADLKGKVIGVSDPAGGEVPVMRALMASAGLAENTDYTFAAIGEGGALTYESLSNGTAAAYSSSNFDIAALTAAGMPLRQLLPAEFKYFPSNSPTVTCDYYEANKALLTGFARAVAKATVFSAANPVAAKAITKTYQPDLFEDEALANSFWDVTVGMMTPPPEMAGQPLGTINIPGWEQYLSFASQGTVEEGALPPDSVDLAVLLTDELIPEINNFDKAAVEAEAAAFVAP